MFIKLEPLDTLFFRTGRPFQGSEDTWAETIFPPSPSTIYGALRSFLIFKGGTLEEFNNGTHKYRELIGRRLNDKKAEYGNLQIKGIFIAKDNKIYFIYFPTPFDLVSKKGNSEQVFPLKFQENPKIFISNYSLKNLLISQKKEQTDEAEGFLDQIYFKRYLLNQKETLSIIKANELFQYEPKVGIRRDNKTFTSEKGYLYRIPMIRLKNDKDNNTHFLIEIDEIPDFPEEGVFQLGGEGKSVKFNKSEEDLLSDIKNLDIDLKNGYFKIYLTTPAVFKKGWRPSWINDNYEGEYNGIKLKLLCCALRKPVSIGGWDFVKNQAKPMRRAVPAGSVYYFQILDNNIKSEKIKATFHFKNISDDFDDIKYSKEGFGLAIVGKVNL